MAVDTTGAFLAIEKYCVLVAVDVSKVSCLNWLATRDSGCCDMEHMQTGCWSVAVIWNRDVAAKQVYYSDRDAAGTQGTVISSLKYFRPTIRDENCLLKKKIQLNL